MGEPYVRGDLWSFPVNNQLWWFFLEPAEMTPKVQWLLGFLLSQTHKMTCAVTAQAYGGFPLLECLPFAPN